MLKSFIWMFKTDGFKKHFLYMFFGSLLSYALAFGLIFTNIPFFIALAYLLSILPTLYIFGYFWNLTEQIIDRSTEIAANNVYDGKIKEVFSITLPNMNFFKTIWRGISSIFAIIMLILPFIGLYIAGFKFENLRATIPACSIILILYCVFLIPAMMWNYANRNSVFAAWNIRKVIYIMGNYPLKYFSHVTLMVVLAVLNSMVDSLLVKILPTTSETMSTLNVGSLITGLLVCLVFGIKYLYFIYVNAYLLGTITPTSET